MSMYVLVLFSVLCGVGGLIELARATWGEDGEVMSLARATFGGGFIAFALLCAVWARIAQSEAQHTMRNP